MENWFNIDSARKTITHRDNRVFRADFLERDLDDLSFVHVIN